MSSQRLLVLWTFLLVPLSLCLIRLGMFYIHFQWILWVSCFNGSTQQVSSSKWLLVLEAGVQWWVGGKKLAEDLCDPLGMSSEMKERTQQVFCYLSWVDKREIISGGVGRQIVSVQVLLKTHIWQNQEHLFNWIFCMQGFPHLWMETSNGLICPAFMWPSILIG